MTTSVSSPPTCMRRSRSFVRMDAPVIAAVNGTAAGAGVGLVAMADLALCARSSKFNLAYTNAGLTPDAGTVFPAAAHARDEAHHGAAAAQSHAGSRLRRSAGGWSTRWSSDEQLLRAHAGGRRPARAGRQRRVRRHQAADRALARRASSRRWCSRARPLRAHAVGAEGRGGHQRIPREAQAATSPTRASRQRRRVARHGVVLRRTAGSTGTHGRCASTSSCARRASRAPKRGTSRSSGGCARRATRPSTTTGWISFSRCRMRRPARRRARGSSPSSAST